MTAQPSALCPSSSLPVLDFADPRVYGLVRRMFFSRFSTRVRWAGLDPDDALQDIYVGLLTRSQGRSRWNPERGALSTWLYWAMNGMTINMADKARRAGKRGTVGREADAAESYDAVSMDWDVTARDVEDLAADMEVPVSVVVALADGADPFCAAMDSGLDFFAANDLVAALGMR